MAMTPLLLLATVMSAKYDIWCINFLHRNWKLETCLPKNIKNSHTISYYRNRIFLVLWLCVVWWVGGERERRLWALQKFHIDNNFFLSKTTLPHLFLHFQLLTLIKQRAYMMWIWWLLFSTVSVASTLHGLWMYTTSLHRLGPEVNLCTWRFIIADWCDK